MTLFTEVSFNHTLINFELTSNFSDLNEQPLVIVQGHNKIDNTSFGHAVVMTECILAGTTIHFKLKNSLGGAHLKGTVDFSEIRSNQRVLLTQIKNQNPNYTWTMNCYLTFFVRF